jgi:membrane-associated protein
MSRRPPLRTRLVRSLRTGRPFQIAAALLIALVIAVLLALVYGDLPEIFEAGGRTLRDFVRHYSYLPGFALLYLEESGVPLPAPGDVFVMYVGIRVPHQIAAWVAAWLGLILAVVMGATNLYLISRRWGRKLAESQYAEYVHLSHERLLRAEVWFKRYGVLAIIFGRHIPGFRIPITVACGVFRVRYRVFAPSVAVSTAIWAGVVLTLGVLYGPHLAQLLRAHTSLYFVWAAIVVALVASVFVRQRLRARRAARLARSVETVDRGEGKADRTVESPGS